MRAFFDRRQLRHRPVAELHNGGFAPYQETPDRAESILDAIGPAEPPKDLGEGPILAIHSAEYLDFLKSAHALWQAAGRQGYPIPYAWPVVGRRP